MHNRPHPEQQYLDLLQELLDFGDQRIDRTGVGTRALFGRTLRFDLAEGFPVFTTKKIFWKTAFKEMLWMLQGGRNIRELLAENVRIWTDWPLKRYREKTGEAISQEDFEARILAEDAFAAAWGDLGPVYGAQWRRWKTADGREIDQIQELVEALNRIQAHVDSFLKGGMSGNWIRWLCRRVIRPISFLFPNRPAGFQPL